MKIYLYKWLICSWLHRKHRCYPRVDLPVSKEWHCTKCHPCGKVFDILLKEIK